MNFEWDPRKATKNLRKHGIRLDETATMFGDPLALTFSDPDHFGSEERLITFGLSLQNRVLIVSHTLRHPGIRVHEWNREAVQCQLEE